MRRVLAAIAAALMIAAGFYVWTARDDTKSVDVVETNASGDPVDTSELVVACIREADVACAEVGDVPHVGFVTSPAVSTEKELAGNAAAKPDAWVTTALGYERVRLVATSLVAHETLASTRVVVVTRTGNNGPAVACKGALDCLATTAKVSFPSISQAGTGLTIATDAVLARATPGSDPVTVDEIAGGGDVVEGLRKATKSTASTGDFVQLTSVKLIDAIVTTEAEVRVKQPAGVSSAAADAAPIPILLVTGPTVSKERATAIAVSLRRELLANGFDAAGGAKGFPDPIIAADVAQSLS